MEIETLRETLKDYAKQIKDAGGECHFYDYDLGLNAIFHNVGIPICQQFRPERDGAMGYVLVTADRLKGIIAEYG